MLKRINTPLFLLILLLCSCGEGKALLEKAQDFPSNFIVTDSIHGDLNGDKVPELILLIKDTKANKVVTDQFGEVVDRNRRGIIIQDGQHRKTILENLNCFSSENEDGGVYFPPELWINIEDQELSIHYSHGRYGYWIYTFMYRENAFQLIRYFSNSSRSPVIEKETKYDLIKGAIVTRTNTNQMAQTDGEEVYETEEISILVNEFIKLCEVTDFDFLYESIEEKYQ